MSGGRATVNRKRGIGNHTQCGDISAVSPEGHKLIDLFVVECKTYRSLDIAQGLLLGRGQLASFWKQVCAEAEHANENPPLDRNVVFKQPLLVAKQSRFESLLITSEYGYNSIANMDMVLSVSYVLGALPAYVLAFKSLLQTKCPL